MLELQNIHAGYGKLKILSGVNINILPGTITAIIGPNGAGKSTILKAIFSIAQVYEGKILLNKKEITSSKTHELLQKGISYVPQGRINFSELTVKENIEMGALLEKEMSIIKKRLNNVFKQFPILNQKRNEKAKNLSGGQQQMLALARALMQNSSLLLLDEPTLGLSPKLQKELFQTLQHLRKEGLTIIMVEQNAKKAIHAADYTYLLENGEVALEGGKEILKNEKIKEIYLGQSR